MKELTLEELSDNGVVEQLIRPGVSHLVRFENTNFCSSELGNYSIVAIGTGCTYQTLEELTYLNDLPSQRQYPVGYWRVK